MKQILKQQLTEKEVIIYLIVNNSDHTYREIGSWLGVSHEHIARVYNAAADKIKFFADHGKLQTTLKH